MLRKNLSFPPRLKSLLALAVGYSLSGTLLPCAAHAATAYEAGLNQARKRGASDAACYARVFAGFASLNRNRHWAVQRRGRSNNIFELELSARCGA